MVDFKVNISVPVFKLMYFPADIRVFCLNFFIIIVPHIAPPDDTFLFNCFVEYVISGTIGPYKNHTFGHRGVKIIIKKYVITSRCIGPIPILQ